MLLDFIRSDDIENKLVLVDTIVNVFLQLCPFYDLTYQILLSEPTSRQPTRH